MTTTPLTAYSLSSEGHGVAKNLTTQKVVFIPNLLPGEQAVVELSLEKKNYSRGTVQQRLNDSTQRVPEPCPYAQGCGGCAFMHIDPATHMDYKKQFFLDHLVRIGKWPRPMVEWVEQNLELKALKKEHYRRRVRLHARDGKVGFLQAGSHTLQPISSCLVATKGINQALPQLISFCAEHKIRKAEFCLTENADHSVCLVSTPEIKIPGFTTSATVTHPFLGLIHTHGTSFIQAHEDCLTEYCQGIERSLNSYMSSLHVRHARAGAPALACLDLFSGAGVFSYLFSQVASRYKLKTKTYAVEGDAAAIQSLKKLYTKDDPSVQGRLFDVFQFDWTKHHKEPLSAVLVNPPRTGASPEWIKKIASSMAPHSWIGYLSCDSASFARDSAALLEMNFRPNCAMLVDAFGYTPHYEVFVGFEKIPS